MASSGLSFIHRSLFACGGRGFAEPDEETEQEEEHEQPPTAREVSLHVGVGRPVVAPKLTTLGPSDTCRGMSGSSRV